MQTEIISIGTEILLGHIVNTNAAYISKKLASLGINLYYHTTIGDNEARLVKALREALSRSDIVFTTGGLGPTVDDITTASIASAISQPLVFKKEIEKLIDGHYGKIGLKTPACAKRQAYVPAGSKWFKNTVGTAPGILAEYGKKMLFALPGPPRELIPIFEKNIIPCLKKKGLAGRETIKTRTVKIVGLVEADVNRIVKDLLSMSGRTTLGIYVHLGEVHLKITGKATLRQAQGRPERSRGTENEKSAGREIEKIEKKIRKRLGNHVYGVDSETLEYAVGKMLAGKKKTLAVAESATGGLISNRITDVSGSSAYFKMGVIAYSNKAKVDLVGVPEEKIRRYGAVSKEVALSLAEGIRKLAKTSIAAGVTGIAGPTGATRGKPVGLFYISVVSGKVNLIKECRFIGSREDIKHQASTTALDLIRVVCSSK